MATEPCKLFVGGIHEDTTEEGLRNYFSSYGEVTDCVVMHEKENPKKSRRFGFVTFSDPSGVTQVMQQKPHFLDSKEIDPKPAWKKTSNPQQNVKKLFVGGISTTATKEEIKEQFEQYGAVENVDLKYDKDSDRMRGFGFVEMKDEKAAEKLIDLQWVTFKDRQMEVKKAQSRNDKSTRGQQFPQHMSYGYPRGTFPQAGYQSSGNFGYPAYGGGNYNFSGSYPPGYNQQSYNSSYQNHGGFAYNQGTGYNYGGGSYEGQSTGGRGSDQRTESYGQGNSGYPYPGQHQGGSGGFSQGEHQGRYSGVEGYNQGYGYPHDMVGGGGGYGQYQTGGASTGGPDKQAGFGGASAHNQPPRNQYGQGFNANH